MWEVAVTSDKHQPSTIRIFRKFKQHNANPLPFYPWLKQKQPQSSMARQPSNQLSQRVTVSLMQHHQKRLVMAENGLHLMEVMTTQVPMMNLRNLMEDLVRGPRKQLRLKKSWKRKLGSGRLLTKMMTRVVMRLIMRPKEIR